MTILKTLLLSAIGAYQKLVSPLLPNDCRFHPSCSAYAAETIKKHGAWRGTTMTVKRVSKCHPWHPGGFDPVD